MVSVYKLGTRMKNRTVVNIQKVLELTDYIMTRRKWNISFVCLEEAQYSKNG